MTRHIRLSHKITDMSKNGNLIIEKETGNVSNV